MKKIISFKIDFFRKKFSIYGLSNILAFILSILLFLFGARFIYNKLINLIKYYYIFIFFGSFIMISVILPYILPSKKTLLDIQKATIFFNSLDERLFTKYEKNKKWISFIILYFIIFFPYKFFSTSNIKLFVILFSLIAFLILISSFLYRFNKEETIKVVITIISTFIVVITFVDRINYLEIISKIHVIDNAYIVFFIILDLIFITFIYKNINSTCVTFPESKNLFFKTIKIKNIDLLYIIRNVKFIEPLIIIVIGFFSTKILNDVVENTISELYFMYSYVHVYYYVELLTFENRGMLFGTGDTVFNNIKKIKIFNTILISFVTILITFIVLPLGINIIKFITIYTISLISFLITSLIFKLSFEKKNGKNLIISEKETIKLFIFSFVVNIVISYFVK